MIPENTLELGKAAYIIAAEMCKVRKGESVLITADSSTDMQPVIEVAKVCEALGAKVMVAYHSTPRGYGKVADPDLPAPLVACIPQADVWLEFNKQWLLYSTPWIEATGNGKTRSLFLGGIDTPRIVRCISRLDMDKQERFQNAVVELTKKAGKMRITNPSGTYIAFENDPGRPVLNELRADRPGPHFLIGQIGWAPVEESINGKIVFDGAFSGGGEAELGNLKDPVELEIKKGRIAQIRGKREAEIINGWLKRLNDPGMFNLAHVCYGFNPGAVLSGLCTEDERVWGSTEWGMGYQGPMFDGALPEAISHADGICLNSTVWLDGSLLVKDGKVVNPGLRELASSMGK
jgi:2,5-dihydroxypyridine 5,6-dioxygenase